MSHAGPAEIHDHAYGFKASPHVAECAECGRRAAAVAAERSAIRRAMAEEPAAPPAELLARRRLPLAAVAAAALLLAVLAGLLFHRPGTGTLPGDVRPPASDDALDRLSAELRSPSPLRRGIAALALKAYGEAALGKIVKANPDPSLFAGYRLKPRDTALQARLDAARLDLSFENASLDQMLRAIEGSLKAKIVLEPAAEDRIDRANSITFKVKALSGTNVLKLLLSQIRLDFRCEEGIVVLLDPEVSRSPSAPRAPVRIGRDPAAATRLLESLRGADAERRGRAVEGLRRLGFAAEEALWRALDSRDADVQGPAEETLCWLYTPAESAASLESPRSVALKKAAYGKRVTIDMQSAPLPAIVDYLRETSLMEIHIVGMGNPHDRSISFKGTDLPVHAALVLMLEPRGIGFRATDGVLRIVPAEDDPDGPRPQGNFWTSPEEALRIERALASLAASTLAERDRASEEFLKMGDRALALLHRASRLLHGETAGKCRDLRARILAAVDPEGLDEPAAEELQRRSPTQQAVLDRARDVDAEGLSLEELIKPYGVKATLKAEPGRTFTFASKDVSLGSLLKALTLPFGLDFYLEGEAVVVDTAPNVRAALERKE